VKLTRTVHVGSLTAFYDHAGKLIPDVNVTTEPGSTPADRCIMFVDSDLGEAHAFLFTAEQAQAFAQLILAPTVEVHRTIPGRMLGANGDAG